MEPAMETDPHAPIPWTTARILEATGGDLLSGPGDRVFHGISTDSRKATDKDFFVALRGETHDAHTFVPGVVEAGVKGVLIAADAAGGFPIDLWRRRGVACVAVRETTEGLGRLAAHQRRRAGIQLAAVTGSNGKTTTRAMTAAVLEGRFNTLSSRGNFNNEIGLPLTLLELTPDHRRAVVELGMNHPGEIRRLTRICDPDIGVITNIGPAHLEGVGSMEGIMAAKGELLEEMRSDGTAVLNGEDHRVAEIHRRLKASGKGPGRALFFGLSEDADVRATGVEPHVAGTDFTIVFPDGRSATVHLAIPGTFMVSNALAAAAVGHGMGMDPAEIARGLRAFRPVKGRLNVKTLAGGIRLIDDTYNANPGSMAAAIRTLISLKGSGRAVLVCGDMFELGDFAAELHREIGTLAARSGVARLYAVGPLGREVAAGALAAGMGPGDVRVGDHGEIEAALPAELSPGDWVLVKGSRAMGMEIFVEKMERELKAG